MTAPKRRRKTRAYSRAWVAVKAPSKPAPTPKHTSTKGTTS